MSDWKAHYKIHDWWLYYGVCWFSSLGPSVPFIHLPYPNSRSRLSFFRIKSDMIWWRKTRNSSWVSIKVSKKEGLHTKETTKTIPTTDGLDVDLTSTLIPVSSSCNHERKILKKPQRDLIITSKHQWRLNQRLMIMMKHWWWYQASSNSLFEEQTRSFKDYLANSSTRTGLGIGHCQ